MDDKLSIRVKIIDRIYPMRIARKDEERIRKAVDIINEHAAKYRNLFSNYDAQDHLSMVALHLATKVLKYEEDKELSELKQSIGTISENLSQFIEQERSFT